MRCEADTLAAEAFEDEGCPPCENEATVSVMDRWLCEGCADALERIRSLGRSMNDRGAL